MPFLPEATTDAVSVLGALHSDLVVVLGAAHQDVAEIRDILDRLR